MARLFKAKFRVASDEVQGPGSWVEFQRPTWGIAREVKTGDDLLAACIVAWNWTDDDDNPLPLPKDAEGLLTNIPQVEARWLVDHSGMNDQKEALKNSSSTSLPT
ncbi:MAG: hypothetical protein WC710_14275 [Gallionella sp.]|jgi:hypothetical protein